ncbi:carboxypeptidase-like regulatory domain-containing protein [Engelhardtia mirabilis]|uniref:Nickel uptake substrate-specific transmembrane region n=1 Tax=Engelhardtia mirabilis TaxID=2528011 RepID=A0A518BPT5_9BACT|nr:Nickel uptake substrate-specific transmembrane region [Planctomycetes bacterium Pla133]QDV03309.1 Nickel uptake substrate-specific transmembrane region [Planctomycetes bacterium Pla86]
MKNLGLILAALALLAGGLVAYLLVGRTAPEEDAGIGGAATAMDRPVDATPTAPASVPLASSGGRSSGREELAADPAAPAGSIAAAQRAPESAGGSVRGRVVDPVGAGLAGMLVAAYAPDLEARVVLGSIVAHVDAARSGLDTDEEKLPLAAVMAADDGSFELTLPRGRRAVQLAAVGPRHFTALPLEALADDSPIELRCKLGARVVGTIIPPDGHELANLAGIAISMDQSLADGLEFTQGASPSRKTVTDVRGEFSFPAVGPDTSRRVLALPDSLASASAQVSDIEAGEVRQVFLELSLGATLRGRVVDELGQGIGGAQVTAAGDTGLGVQGKALREAESAADGQFVLEHVAPVKLRVRAEAEGFLPRSIDPGQLQNGDTVGGLTLSLAAGQRIRGVVLLPDGSPAPGAELVALIDVAAAQGSNQMDLWGSRGSETESDEDGTFSLEGLKGRAFVIDARVELDADDARVAKLGGRHFWAHIEGCRPSDDMELRLQVASVLSGRVVDAAARPVTEFSIVAEQPSSSPLVRNGPPQRFWFEHDDGRFEIAELSDGLWSLRASAPGFAISEAVEVTLPDSAGVQISLVDGVIVSGRVATPRGDGVGGAVVTLDRNWIDAIVQLDSRQATSLEDGSFELRDQAPGELALVAKHPDWADSETITVGLPQSGRLDGVELVLRQGGRITGVVYDEDGQPAPGAQVICQNPQTFEPMLAPADDNGRFGFGPLKPGTYQVVSMGNLTELAEGGGDSSPLSLLSDMKVAMVDVVDGETVEVELGVPPSNPVEVSGRVTSAGEPVTTGAIQFIQESKGMDSLKFAEIGADGRYEVTLNEPGDYLVTIQPHRQGGMSLRQNNIEYRKLVPEGPECRIDLTLPDSSISGRVTDQDGEPLDGVIVNSTRQEGVIYGMAFGGGFSTTTTDEDGRYELTHMRPGRYQVTAGGTFFGMQLSSGQVRGRINRADLVIEADQHLEGIDFELGPPITVTGTVRSTNGEPVAAATIFVRDAAGNPIERFSMILTDASGRFRFEGLAPGEYSFSARNREMASIETDPVEVNAENPPVVNMVAEVGTTLIARIELDDEPSIDASVRVFDEREHDVSGMVGYPDLMAAITAGFESGEFRIGPLAPGKYRVEATAPDGRSKSKVVVLGGSDERRVRIRIH